MPRTILMCHLWMFSFTPQDLDMFVFFFSSWILTLCQHHVCLNISTKWFSFGFFFPRDDEMANSVVTLFLSCLNTHTHTHTRMSHYTELLAKWLLCYFLLLCMLQSQAQGSYKKRRLLKEFSIQERQTQRGIDRCIGPFSNQGCVLAQEVSICDRCHP